MKATVDDSLKESPCKKCRYFGKTIPADCRTFGDCLLGSYRDNTVSCYLYNEEEKVVLAKRYCQIQGCGNVLKKHQNRYCSKECRLHPTKMRNEAIYKRVDVDKLTQKQVGKEFGLKRQTISAIMVRMRRQKKEGGNEF